MEQSSQKEARSARADSPLDTAIARAGLDLGALSHDLRVARETIWNWRKRGTIPRGDHLVGLADRLGMHPREVLALVVAAQPAAPAAPSAQLEPSEICQ